MYVNFQLQLLSEMFEWKKERPSHTRLRAKMRAYLPLELINAEFETEAKLFTGTFTWPHLLKVSIPFVLKIRDLEIG